MNSATVLYDTMNLQEHREQIARIVYIRGAFGAKEHSGYKLRMPDVLHKIKAQYHRLFAFVAFF